MGTHIYIAAHYIIYVLVFLCPQTVFPARTKFASVYIYISSAYIICIYALCLATNVCRYVIIIIITHRYFCSTRKNALVYVTYYAQVL